MIGMIKLLRCVDPVHKQSREHATCKDSTTLLRASIGTPQRHLGTCTGTCPDLSEKMDIFEEIGIPGEVGLYACSGSKIRFPYLETVEDEHPQNFS